MWCVKSFILRCHDGFEISKYVLVINAGCSALDNNVKVRNLKRLSSVRGRTGQHLSHGGAGSVPAMGEHCGSVDFEEEKGSAERCSAPCVICSTRVGLFDLSRIPEEPG